MKKLRDKGLGGFQWTTVDRRFDVNALNPLSVSYLCVPFLDMGVIIALNKNHQISKAAVPFPAMDEPIPMADDYVFNVPPPGQDKARMEDYNWES